MTEASMYGYLEAQEAASISPDMFAEFLMPHFRKLAAKFKLICPAWAWRKAEKEKAE